MTKIESIEQFQPNTKMDIKEYEIRRMLIAGDFLGETRFFFYLKKLYDVGWEIIAEGGITKNLQDLGFNYFIPGQLLDDQPSVLGGQNLPNLEIFSALIADLDSENDNAFLLDHGIEPISLAFILLNFDRKFVGGDVMPSTNIAWFSYALSAIQSKEVCIVTDHQDCESVVREMKSGGLTDELRSKLRVKALDRLVGQLKFISDLEKYNRKLVH